MYLDREFIEKVKDFLIKYTGDTFILVDDANFLRRFNILWNICVPYDVRPIGYIGGVSESLKHEVVVYPHMSIDLQGAAYDLDQADIELKEFLDTFYQKPRKGCIIVSIEELRQREKWIDLEMKLPWTTRYLRMLDELAREYSIKYNVSIVFSPGFGGKLQCRDYAYFKAEKMDDETKLELIKKHVIAYTEYCREYEKRWINFREKVEKVREK
ncbi:MAG: hypothetical protein N3F64_01820 [Nitrososphaeria archaeon]|nr:hypothetical protein [Nitrososphaeria archaeon]